MEIRRPIEPGGPLFPYSANRQTWSFCGNSESYYAGARRRLIRSVHLMTCPSTPRTLQDMMLKDDARKNMARLFVTVFFSLWARIRPGIPPNILFTISPDRNSCAIPKRRSANSSKSVENNTCRYGVLRDNARREAIYFSVSILPTHPFSNTVSKAPPRRTIRFRGIFSCLEGSEFAEALSIFGAFLFLRSNSHILRRLGH